MDLTDCHRVAIPGDPMCGLYVIRKGHGHEDIYNFLKETATNLSFFLFYRYRGDQFLIITSGVVGGKILNLACAPTPLQVYASPTETAIG